MYANHFRRAMSLLEITVATAILGIVTMVATTSVVTGSGMTTSVTRSSNAVGTAHMAAQGIASDMRYADVNKIYLAGGNSYWRDPNSTGSAPRYFSFKRCTGFQAVTAASNTTLASLDRMVIYGEGVILRFAQDPTDNRLGILSQTVYALDSAGATGAVLQQDKVLASGIAWQYWPTKDATAPVDGFDITDISGSSVGSVTSSSAAQGNELRLRIVAVTDPAAVRAGSTAYDLGGVRLSQTAIFLRSSQFDKFGLQSPVITSATATSGSVGEPFQFDIKATNDPTSFTASSLPAGLMLNANTGRISGTPTATANVNSTIIAANGVGTGSAILAITITGQRPTITSSLTWSLQTGQPCTYVIAATAPSTVPVTSFGATGLPTGLSLSTNGALVGSCSTAGNVNIAISATNANGTTSRTLAMSVVSGPLPAPVIGGLLTASGSIGTAFKYDISASNFPTSYAATGLPTWLTCNAQGTISGTPTSTFNGSVVIKATNASGTDQKNLYITVTSDPIPVIQETDTGWNYTQGQQFSYRIQATNSPTSFAVSNKPGWMSNPDANGNISGTITTTTINGPVTLVATNAAGDGIKSMTLVVNAQPAPVVTSGTATASVNTAFSYKMVVNNNPYQFGQTSKPAWLNGPDNAGVFSGTPTAEGTVGVVMTATNYGGTGTGSVYIQVGPDPNRPSITYSTATTTVLGKNSTEEPAKAIIGSITGKAGATLDTSSFVWTCSTMTGTNNGTLIERGWVNSEKAGLTTNQFRITVPTTGVATFTITATIKDSAGLTGSGSATY